MTRDPIQCKLSGKGFITPSNILFKIVQCNTMFRCILKISAFRSQDNYNRIHYIVFTVNVK